MSQNVNDHLLESLKANGVRRIHAYPDRVINEIMGALNRADGRIAAMADSTSCWSATRRWRR